MEITIGCNTIIGFEIFVSNGFIIKDKVKGTAAFIQIKIIRQSNGISSAVSKDDQIITGTGK